jgi:hypothetical protein
LFKTLEDYLRDGCSRGRRWTQSGHDYQPSGKRIVAPVHDYALTARIDDKGLVHFHVQPQVVDGDTLDFVIVGNQLIPEGNCRQMEVGDDETVEISVAEDGAMVKTIRKPSKERQEKFQQGLREINAKRAKALARLGKKEGDLLSPSESAKVSLLSQAQEIEALAADTMRLLAEQSAAPLICPTPQLSPEATREILKELDEPVKTPGTEFMSQKINELARILSDGKWELICATWAVQE